MTPPLPLQGPSLLGATLHIPGSARIDVRSSARAAFETRERQLLNEQLQTLRGALESLRQHERASLSTSFRREASAAEARSSAPLALEAVATFTTLRSTQEVNTTPTSFSPFGPSVSGASTTLPTLGGIYSGAQGDDTLTFEFRQNRTVGDSRQLNVRVRDGGGNLIETLRFAGLAPDTPVALANGLTLSLSAGDAERLDTFTVDVSKSVGSAVDPTRPFDGVRNANPNFELGLGVSAGSFDVNGVQIDVAADDSIDSVLTKITNSGAGVTASFDVSSESVVLTQQTPGSAPDIRLGNDTSGFLAATKLAAASAVAGQDAQDPVGEPIANVPALSGIQSGTFSVNGVTLDVDVAVDTLGDVLDRINTSGAGVDARLDPDSLVLSIASLDPKAELVLDDGTSNFFSGVKVTPTTYRAVNATSPSRNGFDDLDQVRRDVFELRRSFNTILTYDYNTAVPITAARNALREAISKSFEHLHGDAPSNILRSGFGIDFDFTSETEVAAFDDSRFRSASIEDFEALHDFLFGSGSTSTRRSPGLIEDQVTSLDSLQGGGASGLAAALGKIVDLFA